VGREKKEEGGGKEEREKKYEKCRWFRNNVGVKRRSQWFRK
jgi:hypothetical protein